MLCTVQYRCWALVKQRLGLGLVFGLSLQPLITLAHLVVGNQGRNAPAHQLCHIGITVVTRIDRHHGLGLWHLP